MSSITVETSLPNLHLYDLELLERATPRSPVVLKVDGDSRGPKFKLRTVTGDETFNLSAVLGNKFGEFEWGSAGFEQSSRDPRIEYRALNRRIFCVELQDKLGKFNHREFDLDEKFELTEYVHQLKKESYCKLGLKVTPPPRVSSFAPHKSYILTFV